MVEGGPPRDAAVQVILGSGRTWFNYIVYGVFAMGVIAILLSIYFVVTLPGLLLTDLVGALGGVAAFIVGLAYLDRIPRRVRLSPDLIEIQYLASHLRIEWAGLEPPIFQRPGFIDFRTSKGTKGVWGFFTVTTNQARAILNHPSCPPLDLPAEVVAELKQET